MKTFNCLGYSIFTERILPSFSNEKKTIINTINPHCYCVAKKDDLYRQALLDSDILLPDGIGIVWAAKVINRIKIKRFAGYDLHIQLLEQINETGGRVFYMGSTNHTLEKIKDRLEKEYPKVTIGYYSPPYKPVFSDEENKSILDSINQFHPDVLFIGMTAPKQEKWVQQHHIQINARVIASIGAVFDFYSGTIKRPGKFWISAGLEWLPRFLREPKRLWRRNLISTPVFVIDVICSKFKSSIK